METERGFNQSLPGVARTPRASFAHRLLSALIAVTVMLAGSLVLKAGTAGLASAQGTVWQPLNRGLLPHVTVTALAVDPRNTGRVYAGTTGPDGLWISDDGGPSGHFAASAIAGRVPYALSVDPARPDDILAGTDAGLYHSGDTGQTWQPDVSLPTAAVYTLARDAAGTVLAAGVGPAIYRRAAGTGTRWEPLAPLPGATAVLSLATSPHGNLILAGTDGAGLFRSRDGGRTWDSVSEIGRTFVAALTFVGTDGQSVYARTRLGLFMTTDAAIHWQPVAKDLPGRVDALGADEQGDVYLGTSEGVLYRRAADGENWQRWGTGIGIPGLFSSLLMAPGNRARWYAGTSNGLYLSDDAGLSWHLAQPGPGVAGATTLAMAADGALYLGNSDGVFRSTDGGQQWEPRDAGLPADTVLALAPATGDPNLIYAGLAGQGVYCSDDGGRHWKPTGWANHGAPAVLVDPSDPQHLFIRVTYERVYESRDGGQTWGSRWEGLGLSTQIISLAMDPQQGKTLYAGGTEGFFRSLDGAAHWQSTGAELASQTVFTIAIDPYNGHRLYAGATNGAYLSADNGEHWARWGQGLENVTVTALALSPQNPQLVFAGTKYQGVFQSQDGGRHWQFAGPAPVSVNSLLLSPDGHSLYAATATGFYRMQVETK
jgi:photosystem II stability/assembly factor-like uncharacterized protein